MDPSKDGDEDDRFVSSKQRRGESLLRQRTTTTTTVLPKDVSSTIHIKSFYPTHGTTEPHSKGNVSKEEQRTQPLLHNDRQQLINDGQLHLFWVSNWVAGMCSGAVSSIACAPLDLVRTRLQVWSGVVGGRNEAAAGSTLPHDATTPTRRAAPPSAPPSIARIFRDIIQRDGLQGCFRGLTATLLTVPAFWGVYFPLYDDFKWRIRQSFPETNSSIIHMGSAVSAGAIADVLCNPMFVVRTRLQTEAVHTMYDHPDNNSKKNNTIVQTIQQLYKEGGLLTFWRGMTANLLGLTHVAVQFPVYEQLKTSLRQHRCAGMDPGGKSIFSPDVTDRSMGGDTVIDLLVASGLSKMTASLLTYPHETIRSRMMDVRTTRTISFVQTCRSIYAADGIVGFYAGLSVSLIRVIPNTMLTFLVYETTLPWVQHQLFP